MTTNLVKRNNGGPSFSNVMDQVFKNSISRFFDDDYWGLEKPSLLNGVPVNIRETDKTYEMELVAPGCNKEDFKINLQGNLLTVSFERVDERNEKDDQEKWVRQEYQRKSFSRSFTIDESVETDKINARYENGLLRLTLPKSEKATQSARSITIG